MVGGVDLQTVRNSPQTRDQMSTPVFWYLPYKIPCTHCSVPTPQVTDSISVAWAPMAPNKERVYRIDSKLSVDNEWKQDAIK